MNIEHAILILVLLRKFILQNNMLQVHKVSLKNKKKF